MSGFVGNASPVFILVRDDQRTLSADQDVYSAHLWSEVAILMMGPDQLQPALSFATDWWPASSGLVDVGGMDEARTVVPFSWGSYYPVSGTNGRFAFVGYARGADGSPLPGASVKLFLTSDDSLKASVVCNANGFYRATTDNAGAHYLVVYKAGPPDITGASINTLLPS